MKTLDRYILGSFLINYFLSLFVLISLYVILDLFVNLDEFTESGKGTLSIMYDIGNFYFYNLPLYFAQLSGVITAFAACATLARMQRNNEIVAVLTSGTSLYRLAVPIVVAGLAMNALVILDHEVVLPGVAPKLARQRDDVQGARVYSVWFVRDGESRLVSAGQFSPKQQTIRNLMVLELSTDPASRGRLTHVVTADKAYWDPRQKGWGLARGIRFSAAEEDIAGLYAHQPMKPEPLDFYPCTLTPEELQLRQTTQWVAFLSTRQLNLLARRGDVKSTQIAQVKHARFTMPIGNMILMLLGMSFFMHRLPGSVLNQGAKALGTCAVAFLISFMGQQMVGAIGVNPAFPAWLPIFIFGPLAVLLLDNVKT
ncbi:MAG TPA: LptF/LptG family permease [Phycisphaerae bacterium]|nr:LptF/LptG family permease [Phycisphaerae bacterium]